MSQEKPEVGFTSLILFPTQESADLRQAVVFKTFECVSQCPGSPLFPGEKQSAKI